MLAQSSDLPDKKHLSNQNRLTFTKSVVIVIETKATTIEVEMKTLMATIIALFMTVSITSTVTAEPVEDFNKAKTFVINEWNEIVDFQKTNWAEGKDQLARNKTQIQDLWKKVTSFLPTQASN